ncbi:MAG: hypothetical protein MRECE_9c037 [Mycoplasmataceae bacterium CE_OT135]|nr:MAG: hypothetical protein MRECE_44c004 [Mycoplasmataceae bacterium CE_OT135]KLL03778.1 MAG: hypothetical protein MRECE_9c037 [Mycoplasmataceae bacterium CE_OT135]
MTVKNKISFPSEEEKQRIYQELEDPNYQYDTFLITEEAPFLTQVKYELCQNILRRQREKQLGLKNLASLFDLEESKVRQLLNCQVWNFTVPDLVSYSKKLHLNLKVKVTVQRQDSMV